MAGQQTKPIDRILPKKRSDLNKTLVCQFVGNAGLGNCLFELAAAYGIAQRLGIDLIWSWKESTLRKFGLEAFGFAKPPFREVPMVSARKGQGNRKIVEHATNAVRNTGHRICAISHPFQSEECFSDHADEVRRMFKLEPLKPEVPVGRTPVAVQVRRGDYVGHPRLDVVTEGYFLNAMDWMRAKLGNVQFIVVSDDPQWCKAKFGRIADVTVMPPQEAVDGLRTMVACEAHIISNSTYGWWGAWLNEKGPVVVPEIWHHRPGSYGDWKPAPDRWVRVSLRRGKTDGMKPGDVKLSSFGSKEPAHKRAIVYPWHHLKDKWYSLRYSLRSLEKHFTDKECPVYILGTARPHWLLNQSRIRFVECWGYESALTRTLEIADEVLWMNDDILFLKDTGWGDCRTPLHFGPVSKELRMDLVARWNAWRGGYLKALDLLEAEGVTEPVHYSTHTPYLWKREELVAVFEKFGVWAKQPVEQLLFNLFPREGRTCNGERVQGLPFGDARYLNHTDKLLTGELKEAIAARFPDYARWEVNAPLDQ